MSNNHERDYEKEKQWKKYEWLEKPLLILVSSLFVIAVWQICFSPPQTNVNNTTITIGTGEYGSVDFNGVWALNASEVYLLANQGNISEVIVQRDVQGDIIISGTIQDGRAFQTYCPLNLYPDLSGILSQKGVTVIARPIPYDFWANIMGWLPFMFIFGAIIFMMWRAQGGGAGGFSEFLKLPSLGQKTIPKTTFTDVGGADEAIIELNEIVGYVQAKTRDKFLEAGARLPRGVLLVGPPGTGKTHIAKATAGEAKVPFHEVSGSEIAGILVGAGVRKLDDLFSWAKKNAPAIIFIDEIDALGAARGGSTGTAQEESKTLGKLLSLMDGFEERQNVFVLAATNRMDIIDTALLRSGRFDRKVFIDKPDKKGREAILKIHSRNKKLGPDISIEGLAKKTSGFVGADLENTLNEAAILMVRYQKSAIGRPEIEEAIDRVLAGPQRKSRVMSPKEKKIISVHESGHVATGYFIPEAPKPKRVSIISRGQALGMTRSEEEEELGLRTKKQLKAWLVQMLGGYAAEEMIIGDISTGAQDDLQRATRIAWLMVTKWGMSEKLGPRTYGRADQQYYGRGEKEERDYSEETARLIDEEVNSLLSEALKLARETISTHRKKLDEFTEALTREETIEEETIKFLLQPQELEKS